MLLTSSDMSSGKKGPPVVLCYSVWPNNHTLSRKISLIIQPKWASDCQLLQNAAALRICSIPRYLTVQRASYRDQILLAQQIAEGVPKLDLTY